MAGKKFKKLIEKSVLAVHEDFNKLVSKVRGFLLKYKDKTHKTNHKGSMENAPAMTRIESDRTISADQKLLNIVPEEVVDGWKSGSMSRIESDKTISSKPKLLNNIPEEVVDGWTSGSMSRIECDKTIMANTKLFNNVPEEVERRIHWTNSPEYMLSINNYQRMRQEPLTTMKGDHPSDRILVAISENEREGNIIVYKKILGKGGFGTVHMGTFQTQHDNDISERLVAVKAIKYNQYIQSLPQSIVSEWEKHFRRLLDNELGAMLICAGHSHIIQLQFVTITSSEVLLGLEFASKGDLQKYIEQNRQLPERHARKWFKDLAEAVVYCHNRGIVHLDIKAENVLVDHNDNVKLTDFGLALIATHPQDPGEYKLFGSRRGTPDCMAPEMLRMNVEDTRLCDAWNLGIVLFNMLAGFIYPFWGKKGNWKNLFFQSIPAEAKTMVRGALELDPSKRLSVEAMLRHPWLQGE